MNTLEKIKKIAHQESNNLIEIRRYLHAHPELSFEETETAKYIANQLDLLNIKYTKDVGGNELLVS